MIAETFAWWLVLTAIGLIALPIAYMLFRRLPGAGIAFARPLGLLLGGYLFWLALTAHLLPNRPGSIVWVFLLLIAVDYLILRRNGRELLRALEARGPLVLATEIVFFLALFIASHIRSHIPEIVGTEKPMDFMLLNAADRSRYYPPEDAWFAGFDVSYYYFGYLIQAMVGNLAAVKTSVAFNLGLTSTAALAATAAFGLAYDLAIQLRRVTLKTAIGAGVAAAIFVTLLGNLEGVLEFGAANGLLPDSVAERVAVANLDSAQESDGCLVPVVCIKYPTEESSFWWWWRATRISPDANSITEFPFFSFILGDLHPHVMSIPYVLTVFALGLSFWRSEAPLSLESWRRRPPLLLLSGVLLGGLGFLNTWDLPTLAFLVALLVIARNLTGRTDRPGPALQDAAGFLAPLLVLAVVFYVPFYSGFSSQADGLDAVRDGGTRPLHSALFWAPLLCVSLPLPLALLASDRAARGPGRLLAVAMLPLALLALWVLILIANGHPIGSAISDRGWNWLTALFFAAALSACLLALWRQLEAPDKDDGAALTPVLGAMSVALLLILGTELFYVQDVFNSRINSVFKLYYQSWLLLGVCGAFGGWWLLDRWQAAVPLDRRLLRATVTVAAVALLGGLLYPVGATLSRTEGLTRPNRSLDGLRAVNFEELNERLAIEWLARRAQPGERLLEAVGPAYSSAARVSARSGVPAVLGWSGHEIQWGRDAGLVTERQADVEFIYSNPSLDAVLPFLRKYGVTYIYVGSVERATYPAESLEKFRNGLTAVYDSGGATIFRMPIDAVAP